MRIGIVGNCQSSTTARWLEQMLPDHEIVHHSIAKPAETYGPASQDLAGCDVIMSQWIGPDQGPLESAVLSQCGPVFIQVPNLIFTGFQPDMGYLRYKDGSLLPSPVGAYHSRIIATCFHIGLGPIRTKTLFNSYVYAQLGYFDEFDKARLNLEEAMARCGLSVGTAELMERGPFMHTINHANIFANRLLAAAAARKAGLTPLSDIAEIPDELSEDTIWPIYPQIAQRAGIAVGDMIYRRATHMGWDGRPRELGLEELIERSFEIYERDRAIIDFEPLDRDPDIIKSVIRRKYQ